MGSVTLGARWGEGSRPAGRRPLPGELGRGTPDSGVWAHDPLAAPHWASALSIEGRRGEGNWCPTEVPQSGAPQILSSPPSSMGMEVPPVLLVSPPEGHPETGTGLSLPQIPRPTGLGPCVRLGWHLEASMIRRNGNCGGPPRGAGQFPPQIWWRRKNEGQSSLIPTLWAWQGGQRPTCPQREGRSPFPNT